MANTTQTPNMLLDLPIPLQQLGAQWAADVNAAFNRVDLHDHSPGKGVKIPTSGININDSLSFQSNNANFLRSTSFINSVSILPNTDIRALYVSAGNLYYNNSTGVAVQLTSGTSINTGALATNVFAYLSVSSNLVIPNNAIYSYLGVQTSASRSITLPSAAGVTAGRYFYIKDRTGSAATNNITIAPAGSDTINGVAVSETINYTYGSEIFISDGASNWMTFKEGSVGATAGALGTIRLSGDLAGTGSTASTPRVVDASPSVKGKIQLAGDLNGDGTASGAPTIGKLTGISGAVSMGSNPSTSNNTGLKLSNTGNSAIIAGISVRNNNNSGNLNVIGMDGFNRVQIGDTNNVSTLNGGLRVNQKTLTGSGNINLDNTSKDQILLCNHSGALSLLLPNGEVGRVITVKDISGAASTNNITVYSQGGYKIEGLSVGLGGQKIIQSDYGSLTLVADASGNWWMI